ncbi:MAG: cation transporter [Desulfovibrionaceae bacterium]
MEKTIKVKGMSCGHCSDAVTKAIETVDGIEKVAVDLGTGRVTYSPASVDEAKVRASVEKAGYEVE